MHRHRRQAPARFRPVQISNLRWRLLQQLLKTSLDNVPAQPYAPETGRNPGPEPRQTAANNPPPPPYRGGPTSAQPALPSTLPADANPRLVGQVLLNHTEAALAHLKLLQIASLPDSPQGSPTMRIRVRD